MKSRCLAVALAAAVACVSAGAAAGAGAEQRRVIIDTLELVSKTEAGVQFARAVANPTIAKSAPDGTTYPILGFAYSGTDIGPSGPSLSTSLYTKNLTTGEIEAWDTQASLPKAAGGIWIVPVPYAKLVVMESPSAVLSPGTGANSQIYLRSTAGTTPGPFLRISNAPGGAIGNGSSRIPDVSVNGRYICYESTATNLVAGDDNKLLDVFVHDRVSKKTTRVSHVSGSTVDADKPSHSCSFRGNGNTVVFASEAGNIVPGDTNHQLDIFAADLGPAGKVTRLSTTSDGKQANGISSWPSFSSDGRLMAFQSTAKNLVPDGANNRMQVYVKDLKTGEVTRVSDSFGEAGNGDSNYPAISPDGKFVAFLSQASNLYPLDTNGSRQDVFVVNLATGEASIVSRNDASEQGNGASLWPTWVGDSKHLLFFSKSNNLVADDKNMAADFFLVTFR